jgi:hypothetical protein
MSRDGWRPIYRDVLFALISAGKPHPAGVQYDDG